MRRIFQNSPVPDAAALPRRRTLKESGNSRRGRAKPIAAPLPEKYGKCRISTLPFQINSIIAAGQSGSDEHPGFVVTGPVAARKNAAAWGAAALKSGVGVSPAGGRP
ncbi:MULTISPECIES: hypothetical protein [Phyllobacteriaceae]|uniref:hypothetical protein n=1 Tax=Phyllobacteriaceae TaxID=69277 RepID=UPI0013779A48|nr:MULTISPECIES: hypothetical protein [Mesorhizobium]MBN9235054.1 hypothetical protein [Mesorhizobium sp.]MDQ0330836.1 hypothetical protein [Mesorhizobium sp. YL-MeA3-2017]